MMRRILLSFFCVFGWFLSIAQTNIPNTTPITQNFDGMGATTTLPSNWRLGINTASPTWAGGATTTTQQASSGAPTSGGTYNWGSTASERAVGAMTSGSFASPNSLMAWFRNTNASTLTQLSISYNVERYRRNSASASVQFYYSTNGSTWTAVAAGNVAAASLPTGTSVYGFNPPNLTINVSSFNVTGLSIATNGDIYLRWNLNTTGSNSQGIGIDDVSVTATFAGACTAPSTQASAVTFSSVTSSTMNVNWTNGNGAGRVVIMNSSNSFTTPTTGSNPAANTVWANAGEQVVYNGTGSGPVSISGLSASTSYWFRVYEYCSPDRVYQSATATGNPNSQTTTSGASAPVLSSPTVTAITQNSAILGATITSDGGSVITARGTVYNTSSPVTSGNNPLAEGGTSTGAFSHTRSALSPQTRYYYAGYATNAIGTSLSPESNFYTYSNPPTTQATGLTATGVSGSQINLSWTAATFPGSGATTKGYVLISAPSPSVPTLASANGQAPAAGVGTIVSSTIAQGATTYNNTGLTANTTYNYLLIPFCWDGTNAATYHYLTTSAPNASGTTLYDVFTQTFGSGTGTYSTASGTSTTFLPNPSSGTTYVRIGTGGGSINLQNTGLCNLGFHSEVRAVAPTGASINKFTPFRNYTPGAEVFFTRFRMLLGNSTGGNTASSGIWYFFQGDGSMYDNASGFSGAEVFTGLRWTFGGSGAITTAYRNGGSWTNLTGTPFAQGNVYLVEVVGNNSGSTVNYTYGSAQSVAANTFDLFINGVLVGNDLAKGAISNTSNINDVTFYGENSTSNVANIFVDEMEISNAIPSVITAPTCDVPSVQASLVNESTLTTTSFTANWTNGNGAKRIVVINTVNTFTTYGIDGTDPAANTVYGGSGEQVVYNGTGSSVNITGLTPSTGYYVRVYEANCSGGSIVYNNCTATDNPFLITTLNIASISTGTISGTPLCSGLTVNVPFTYTPAVTFPNGVSTFTAQLSNSAGSFAAPVNIGSVISDETGSQSISATIPSGTLTGSGYRIRFVSSSPTITGTNNGVDIMINRPSVSISPSGNQTIAANNPGTTLTVTEGYAVSSRQWKYGTVSGGPYTSNLGTGLTEVPLFAYAGTYYIVCESTFGSPCNTTVVSNQVQVTVTGGNPVVTTVSVSGITNSSANSGGNVTSENGYAVSAKGVVWGTTANPVVPSVNATNDGTGLGAFVSSVSPLNPETQYYYRAYATSSFGTSYGSESSFFTQSNPPTVQCPSFMANAFSSSQIDLTWDPATFPATGASVKGYILVRALNPTIPSFTATNGQAPTVGPGSALITSALTDADVAYSNTGLGGNLTYNYLIIPYTWNGVNAQTYSYLTAGALTSSATTPPGACAPPSVQTSGIAFSSVTPNSMLVTLTNGDGDGRIVVAATSPISTTPSNGLTYTASSNFGAGDNLGAFNYVVYRNTGSTFTLNNLSPSTTYYFAVFEYNVAGNCYLLVSPLTGSQATLAAPSVIETFEPGTKGTYVNGSATCNLGIWNFNDALIGTGASDRKNGAKSARIQNTGSVAMLFNKADGIGQVTVYHAKFGTDANSSWRMDVSDDGGATWTAWQSQVINTTSTTLTAQVFNVNLTGNSMRLRIVKTGGGTARLNIDDITITDYVSGSTISVSAVAGSPFCVSDVTGAAVNVNYTATGSFNTLNIFTAQLSDASGDFSIPVVIGTLNSDALSGTIACTIPAGTVDGSGYRIRVQSSDPVLPSAGITQNPNNLTVYLNPPDVAGFYGVNISGSSVQLGWTLPGACYDEIMVVGSLGTLVTANPTGNGTLYTASSVYGAGASGANLPAGEYCLYKSTGSTVTLTGLTVGNTYFFEVFTRKGTQWSNGVILSIEPYNNQVGDFRTTASGNWNASTTWQRFDGTSWVNCNTLSSPNQWPNQGAPGGNVPSTINVTINNGHTVTVTTSHASSPINNLTVVSGGKLFTNSTLLNGNRYLTVYGDIKCFGTIGNGTSTYDNISFNLEGNPTTISGTGNFNCSRMRKNFTGNTTTNIIIAMNIGLRFAASAGSSGTQIYNNASGSVFNFTINENSVVTLNKDVGLSGNFSIDGIDGEGSGERGGTLTVNGTLTIPGTLFAFTDNLTSPVQYIIGTSGVINCVNVCTGNTASPPVATGSAAGTCLLRILNGGKLNMTDNEPFNLRTNTSSPYAYSFGLGTTNNTYDLQPGSIVEYSSPSGTQPIQTQLTYSNLLLSEGAIKQISSTLTVNKDITMVLPAVFDINGQTVQLGGDWNNYGSDGFDEGTAGNVIFNGTDIQNVTCPGGDAFYNFTVSNASVDGVVLRNDIEIKNDLDLGSTGRLNFGPSPVSVNLSKMTASSNTWKGSGAAVMDMSAAEHALFVGCQNPSFSGVLNAGVISTINYNRDNSLSGSGGAQILLCDLTYANLSVSGSDDKNTDDNLTINGAFSADGPTTVFMANTTGQIMTLAGDFTLSGGATMNDNCRDNLDIITSGTNFQEFEGQSKTIKAFNFRSVKNDGGICLRFNNGTTEFNIKNDFALDYTSTALFTDSANTLKVGDDIEIGSAGSVAANFNFVGTFELTGDNAAVEVHISDYTGTGDTKAHLNNLRILTGAQSGSLKQVEVFPTAGSQSLTLKGNLEIVQGTNGAEFDANDNDLFVGGNWINWDATAFKQGSLATVTFNGVTNQQLTCTGGEQFYNLALNKTGNLILNNLVSVENDLNLTAGKVDLNSHNLELGTNTLNGSVSGGNASSYLITWDGSTNGTFVRHVNSVATNYFFPIGDATDYTPATIDLYSGTLSNATLSASVTDAPHPQLGTSTNYLSRYWSIVPSGITAFGYGITYSYASSGAGEEVGIPANMWPFKYNANGWFGCTGSGADFEMGTGSFTPATRTFTWSGLYTFSDFTGNGNGSPLPISLLDFNANPLLDEVQLSWTTLTETNNDYFTIQRSKDLTIIEEIGTVDGAGNSNVLLTYDSKDYHPYSGLSYYRLKQTDFDGTNTYSQWVSVTFEQSVITSQLPYISYHTPGSLTVYLPETISNQWRIDLIDCNGKGLQTTTIYPQDKTETTSNLDVGQLSKGIYFIRCSDGIQLQTIKWSKVD